MTTGGKSCLFIQDDDRKRGHRVKAHGFEWYIRNPKDLHKPYASCRYTHPSIEAAIQLRNEYGLVAEDVESIHIKTYSLAVSGHDHVDILGSYSAKMSIPYSVAAGFIYGKAGLQEFSETGVQDKVVLDLTKRVTVVSDEKISAAFPAVQRAVVELKTTDNRTFENVLISPKGSLKIAE